jgi:hypothetical protein
MRDPSIFLLIFVLIGLIATTGLGDKHPERKGSNPITLVSEAELPAEASLWSGCCSHRDCMEARVSVANQNADWAKVSIAYFPTFDLETKKIHPSKNGKDYFCRQDLSLPPDSKNTRCVFKGRPDYVTALRDNG